MAGTAVPFTMGGPYFADTNLRYVLRFWDVGQIKGEEAAAIYRVYTPIKSNGVAHSENYTKEQLTEIYARRNFPTTEIEPHYLDFTGGEYGEFHGTNSETGQEIYGRIEWIEAVPHVIFTKGIKQDYLITTEDAFNNKWRNTYWHPIVYFLQNITALFRASCP